MKVINLFGSAGAGKSTTALGLTHLLKINGAKAEYVSEYAKYLVMSDCPNMLKYQDNVFANQLLQIEILIDKGLDFIVTDSPLLLSNFYGRKYKTSSDELESLVLYKFNKYNNINYFIEREHSYDQTGRVQTEEESSMDSNVLKSFLNDYKINYKTIKTHNLISSYLAYEILIK